MLAVLFRKILLHKPIYPALTLIFALSFLIFCDLFPGACDGMTYEEIEQTFPEEFERRENDKLAYRYPR